ncbi:MAG: hypothetical protein ACD_9C00216G0004 [uncultured bacterium]|nr:MAG: hypothetical protein ACD_9C00216G0004 [uncultured bacterium]
MFLDIGIGILMAILISTAFEVQLTLLLVSIGILFALGPDLDFLYIYSREHNTRDDYKHRDIIHYPLLYLPIGTGLIFILFGNLWAILFFFASLLHFIHDSIAVGWGIKWLFPFSRKNIAFFYLYSSKLKQGLRKSIFVFDEKKLPKIVSMHGDKDWVKNIYHKWHPIAIVEFLVFIISVLILVIVLNSNS